MKTVAHCLSSYLFTTGQWIHSQLVGLQRYRPVVLAQRTENLAEFPVESLYDASQYSIGRRLSNRLVRRLTGQYPFYASILQREQASLIHAHFGYEGSRCLRAQERTGLPLLTTFYGADASKSADDPSWRGRFQELFQKGAAFLVEGTSMGHRLEELGCPLDKIRLWHLGVDVERIPFKPRSGGDQVRFLIAASFREKKGIPYALAALRQTQTRTSVPFEVVLIGDGPDRTVILESIRQNGLQEKVQFMGWVPYSQLLDEMQRCDILLQPSVTAADGDTEGGAPVVLLDAQASGMPVVATSHADIPEYVVDGESALLAPERDVESLTNCLLRVLDNPGSWFGMGACGRRHVERNYNAALQRAKLEVLYDEFS